MSARTVPIWFAEQPPQKTGLPHLRMTQTIEAVGGREDIRESGVTILLVEQFARLVLGMADVAFVLEHGALAFAGTSQELIDNPSVLHGAYLAGRTALQEVGTP